MYATVYRQHFTLNLKIQRAFANMVLARIRTKCHRNESQNGEQRGRGWSHKKKGEETRKWGNGAEGKRETRQKENEIWRYDTNKFASMYKTSTKVGLLLFSPLLLTAATFLPQMKGSKKMHDHVKGHVEGFFYASLAHVINWHQGKRAFFQHFAIFFFSSPLSPNARAFAFSWFISSVEKVARKKHLVWWGVIFVSSDAVDGE